MGEGLGLRWYDVGAIMKVNVGDDKPYLVSVVGDDTQSYSYALGAITKVPLVRRR